MEVNERYEVPLQAQKMEVLGRLAGAVIHDLNNLLTVIQLNAGLIGLGELDRAEVLSAAEKIDEASCRAAELTRKVLNFARGQADETGPVCLDELVAGLSRLLEPLVAKRVRIEVVSGSHELWAHGNRSAIEQAIMNLVLNAVDAMPGGGRIAISFVEREIIAGALAGCTPGRYVGVAIADEGPGIPAEDRERVFQPFFTTKSTGTGMGLAIVHRIARLHRGAVEFESEPGRGTEFRLWLPEGVAPLPAEPQIVPDIDAQLMHRTVLLVEDDRGIRELARLLLEAGGLQVLAAATGEEAFKLWEQHREEVDLLFTDIVLPGKLSGRDLALAILRENPSLPVLYTSGYSSMGNDQAYFTKTNFLPKPFHPDVLQSTVKAALAGS